MKQSETSPLMDQSDGDLSPARTQVEAHPGSAKQRSFPYRKLFWKWHLYAGLLGGPLLILIAITGALLVFSPEIDEWLRPDLWIIEPAAAEINSQPVSDQTMVETVQTRFPKETIVLYRQNQRPDQPYQFLLFGNPKEGIHDVWVNPYTGEITADRMRETAFVRIVEQLHRRLLSGEIGSSIIELITGWGIVLTLTGCFLWWPRTAKALWNGLTLSFRGSAYKINWRLHNTVGVWVAFFVLMMCLTGMVFSTYSGKLYRSVMTATDFNKTAATASLKSVPQSGKSPVSIDQLIKKVRLDLPENVPLNVRWPRDKTGCFVITTDRNLRPLWSDRSQFQTWTFDQYSGEQLAFSHWDDLHPMRQFSAFSMTVHYGSIFGLPTKLIALVACLGVPILAITGYLIWWWKRKGKRQKLNQRRTQTNQTETRKNPPIPKTLFALLIIVGIVFPTIGLSFLLLLAYEMIRFWYPTKSTNIS